MQFETINDILRHEAEAVMNIPVGESFDKALDLLYHYVHELGGKKLCLVTVLCILRHGSSV